MEGGIEEFSLIKGGMDSIEDFLFILDKNRDIVYLNKKTQKITGYFDGELFSENITELFVSEHKKSVIKDIKELSGSEEIKNKYTIVTKNRDKIPYEFKIKKITKEDGGVIGFIGLGENITEKVKSDYRYKAIFNQTYQYTGLLEPDGTLIEANDTALEFGGIERKDVLDKKIWETYWFQNSEKTRKKVKESFEKARKGEFIRHELEVQGEDTTKIIDFSIKPVKNKHGEIILFIPEGRDITELKKYEKKLKTQRKIYKDLIETSPAPIVIINSESKILYINESALDMIGADTKNEIVGKSALEFVHPSDQNKAIKNINKILKKQENRSPLQYKLIDLDGDVKYTEISGSYTKYNGENAVQIIINDVTDYKKVKNRWQTLVQYSSDIIFVVDRSGTIQYQTPSIERILGYKDLKGEQASNYIHPEDRKKVSSMFENLVEESIPTVKRIEYRFQHKNGKWLWFESIGSNQDSDVIDGYVINSREITERKEHEQELQRYQKIIEASGDAVYTLDTKGRFTYINDRFVKLFGYSKDELIGKHTSLMTDEENIKKAENLIIELLKSEDKTNDTIEMPIYKKNGNKIATEIHIALLEKNGEFQGTTGVIRDITERKKREQRLEVLNRVLRHDILNTVNIIMTSTELISNYIPQKKEIRKHLEKIKNNTQKIVDISKKSRNIQKIIEIGEYKKEKIDIVDIIEKKVSTFQTNYPKAKIKTELPSQSYVYTDHLIDSAIENLIENAIEHNSKQNPKVRISLTEKQKKVRIKIMDNGPGIPNDQIEILQKGEETDLKHLQGLGLWIVLWIIKESGGEIEFIKDNGTIVIITLPSV